MADSQPNRKGPAPGTKFKPRQFKTEVCRHCGSEFSAVFQRKFCSPKCHRDATNAKSSAKRKAALPRTMHRECAQCGCGFSFPTRKGGMQRKYCSRKCRQKAMMAAFMLRKAGAGTCCVDGCANPVDRIRLGLCEMHHARLTRNNSTELLPKRERYIRREGYAEVRAEGHPLARDDGRIMEHRLVAYDKHGGVCPGCHWCGCELEWIDAVVDHLNETKDDNRPENLVVACNNCNRWRGSMLPFIKQLGMPQWQQLIDVMGVHVGTMRSAKGE